MRSEAGASLIELLIASAVMLAATAAVFTLVNDATMRNPMWNDAADLHQRARVAVEAVSRLLSTAGAGVPPRAVPFIEPRRKSTFTTSNTAITIRHAPEGSVVSQLAGDLPLGGGTVLLAIHPGCPVGISACGLEAGMDAVVFDAAHGWHLFAVTAVGPAAVTLMDRVPGRTGSFPAGSTIAEIEETSLRFDAASGTLRQEGPGAGDFPIVDRVSDLHFEYFGDRFAPIPLPSLVDGPLCGSGSLSYDCDLHRIRRIRATVTIASAGPTTPSLTVVADISPRNLQR
jgi:hypothetical protein